MDLSLIFSISEIVLAVFLITAILLQQRGTGIGGAFGGGGDSGNVFATRRGAERILFYATIVAAILFFAIALAQSLI